MSMENVNNSMAEESFYAALMATLQDGQGLADALSSMSTTSPTTAVFRPRDLTDRLVVRLLTVNVDNDNGNADMDGSLVVLQTLVATDPETYVEAVAESLVRRLQLLQSAVASGPASGEASGEASASAVQVSPNLLHLWMYQLVYNEKARVHTLLGQALGLLLQLKLPAHRPEVETILLLNQVCSLLAQLWQSASQQEREETSVVCVRCASVFVQLLVATDDGSDNRILTLAADSSSVDAAAAAASAADLLDTLGTLLANMVAQDDDALQQMAVLDVLLEEGLGVNKSHSQSLSPQLKQFWSTSAFMSPILKMLKDPLLAATALQYVTHSAVLSPNQVSTVLKHIRTVGDPPPTLDADRLPLIHALSRLTAHSHTAGQVILDDAAIRRAWWGDLTRLSNSKLQAAIFMSIRLAIVELIDAEGVAVATSTTTNAKFACKLYSKVGPDNNTNSNHNNLSTTQWLLQSRFVSSPIEEMRIATYALLAVMLRIPDAVTDILGVDWHGKTALLELLTNSNEQRDNSSNARKAYYDVLEAFCQNGTLMGQVADTVRTTLEKKLAMGPHGREPQRWDVATE